jgi:hypothetical protein
MAGSFADLFGTTKTSWKIGKATVDASGLTAARTFTLPDTAGTVALTSDLGPTLGQVLDSPNLPVFL